MLDEWHGFHPYTTWSRSTFDNAETLLAEAGESAIRLGVIRCYMTRHGPGPFVTEDPTLELPEPHNRRGMWQGPVRTGHLDAVALRYAAAVSGGVDAVALTHLDTAARHPLRLCRSYQVDGQRLDRITPDWRRDLGRQEQLTRMLLRARPVYEDPDGGWPAIAADVLNAPVALTSHGPAITGKQALRPELLMPVVRQRRPRFHEI